VINTSQEITDAHIGSEKVIRDGTTAQSKLLIPHMKAAVVILPPQPVVVYSGFGIGLLNLNADGSGQSPEILDSEGSGVAFLLADAMATGESLRDGGGNCILGISASGVGIAAEPADGFGVAGLDISASSNGVAVHAGTGAGLLNTGAVFSGVSLRSGSSDGLLTLESTATGFSARAGVGIGSLAMNASGVGASDRFGDGLGFLELGSEGVGESIAEAEGFGIANLLVGLDAVGASIRSGSAAASLTLDAAFVGVSLRSGSWEGLVVLGASAVGEAPLVPAAEGSGIASLAIGSNATGMSLRVGSGNGLLLTAADAAGEAPTIFDAEGYGTAAISLNTNSVGLSLRSGSGSANLNISALALGSSRVSGQGVAPLLLDATGVGVSIRSGQGVAPLLLDATGVGVSIRSGQGVAPLLLDATGVGVSIRSGQGVAPLLLDADGVNEPDCESYLKLDSFNYEVDGSLDAIHINSASVVPTYTRTGDTGALTFSIINNTGLVQGVCVLPEDDDCAVKVVLYDSVGFVDVIDAGSGVISQTSADIYIHWYNQEFTVGQEKTYSFTFELLNCGADNFLLWDVSYGRGYRGDVVMQCVDCSEVPSVPQGSGAAALSIDASGGGPLDKSGDGLADLMLDAEAAGESPVSISFIGAASADTATVAFPVGTAAGDLALVVAGRNNTVGPSIPSDWTDLGVQSGGSGGTAHGQRAGWRILTSADITRGNVDTWSQANQIGVWVCRGATGVGTNSSTGGNSTVITIPARDAPLTAGSWVVAVGSHRNAGNLNNRTLSSFTNRTSGETSKNIGIWDTNGVVSSTSGGTVVVTNSSGNAGRTVEILN